jgi:hypothetical protein
MHSSSPKFNSLYKIIESEADIININQNNKTENEKREAEPVQGVY